MNFKELKENYVVYVFDRKTMTYEEAKVLSVSVPRFDGKVGQMGQSVVDVTLEVFGKPTTYVFSDNMSKAYNGNLTFATDKGDIIADVRAIRKASEQVLADVGKHKANVLSCNNLLAELDTAYRERQATEERFSKLESSIGDMKTMLMDFITKTKTMGTSV